MFAHVIGTLWVSCGCIPVCESDSHLLHIYFPSWSRVKKKKLWEHDHSYKQRRKVRMTEPSYRHILTSFIIVAHFKTTKFHRPYQRFNILE